MGRRVWRWIVAALAIAVAALVPVLSSAGSAVVGNAVHAPDEEPNHNQVLL